MVDALRRPRGTRSDFAADVRAAGPASRRARSTESQVRPRARDRRRHRDRRLGRCSGARRRPQRQRHRGGDGRHDQAVGHAARDASGAAQRQRAPAPACTSPTRCCSPACARASASPPDRRCRRAARCWPATARRWPQGPTAARRSPTSPTRSSARSGPIPADLTATYAALGYPADAQVGLDGLERIFQNRLAGTPGGRLLAGHRVLAQPAPVPAKPVKTTIVPAHGARRGGRARRPVRRDGGDEPAHRRAAGARRDRLLRRCSRPARR